MIITKTYKFRLEPTPDGRALARKQAVYEETAKHFATTTWLLNW